MFTYAWHIDSTVDETTVIRVYGLDKNNENVCVRVSGFTPYVYLELPTRIKWDQARAQLLGDRLDQILGFDRTVEKKLRYMHKLYGAHINEKGERKLFPYLLCTFATTKGIETLSFKTRYNIEVGGGIGVVRLKMHEKTADPILQFTACRKLPASGWMEFRGKRVEKADQLTLCDHEFSVQWTNTKPYECEILAKPLIMAYDIEANSSNPARMPKSSEEGDKIFQISCVFCRYGDKPDDWEPYLLSLGNPSEKIVSSRGHVEIKTFKTEADLLIGFTRLVNERNPNLMAGFNLLGFDIQYMIERAQHTYCFSEFDVQGFHRFAHAQQCSTSWSSAAFANQEYVYLDTEGRVTIDLLPLVKRDFGKLDNYKLDTIARHFYGKEHKKDPLGHKGIFKCYEMGIKKNAKGEYGKNAQAYMGIVGKYCTAAGTEVSGIHRSTPIEELFASNSKVLSWDAENDILCVSRQTAFFDNGVKDCLRLTLEDGRSITCTGDHRLATGESEWVAAGMLQPGSEVKVGPILPRNITETRQTRLNRLRGYLVTDGCITNEVMLAYFGTAVDASNFCDDIETLCGKKPVPHRNGHCLAVTVPAVLRADVLSCGWIKLGNRTLGSETLPKPDELTIDEASELLGGLFGGDGWCAGINKKEDKFTAVGLTQSRSNKAVIVSYFDRLRSLLAIFEITSAYSIRKRENLYIGSLRIPQCDVDRFMTKVGYRYCWHKTFRTSVALTYFRLRDRARQDAISLFHKAQAFSGSLRAGYKLYAGEYEYPPKYETLKQWARTGVMTHSSNRVSDKLPSPIEFVVRIGADVAMGLVEERDGGYHTYALPKDATGMPTLSLRIVKIEPVGPRPVYDITVDGTHAFVADGVVAHNCVMDSLLVLRLMDTLETWVGLTVMATTCNIQMFRVYTEGQQVRVYAQLYAYCMYDNTVVEKDGYIPGENERYTGAFVFDPVPGVYNDIVPLDFKSLYPSTIIAYNICYTTLVMDDDGSIPDEKCHVMEWQDHQKCLVGHARVTLGSYSVEIKDMGEHREVLALTNDRTGLTPQKQTSFTDSGVKDCVCVTFEDGTVLECTPDHMVFTDLDEWHEISKIPVGARVCCGITMPTFDVERDELVAGDFVFTGDRLIQFYQLLGLLITDGHLTHNRTQLYCRHPIDLQAILSALDALNPHSYSVHRQEHCWCVAVLGDLGKAFRSVEGLVTGNKTTQTRLLPVPLRTASLGSVRAFLSGLFGGDGQTLCWGKGSKAFSTIGFAWASTSEDLAVEAFSEIASYLSQCGISTTTSREERGVTMLRVQTEGIIPFQEMIGFAFCVHKQVRLEAGCMYLRLRHNVWSQQRWIIDRARELKSTMTIEEATTRASEELRASQPVYNDHYTSPTAKQMTDFLRPRRQCAKPMFSHKHFPKPLDYMKSIGAEDVFTGYGVDIEATSIPLFKKAVISIRPIGRKRVYDIGVSVSHSFLANGVVVHNCEHDPIMIEIEELSNYIDKERVKSREIRAKRDSLKVSDYIGDMSGMSPAERKDVRKAASTAKKIAYDTMTIEARRIERAFEPQAAKRKELQSRIKEHYMCEKRKYKWLKEPKGILPTVLENLLDARARTRKRQKEVKRTMGDDPQQQTLWKVLDQRQLSLKVCSNSVYGALGVRSRSYLPLIPAAMCTCYMGRVNIKLAAKVVEEKYGGEIVYGDTDSVLVHFPQCKTTQETWDYGEYVAAEVTKIYPRPLVLEFEEMIYKRYLILKKKQYVFSISDREGNIEENLGKKGVILARRDNCNFVREIYQTAIQMVFDREDRDDILYYVLTEMRRLVAREVPLCDFIITQSIKSTGDGIVEPFVDDDGKRKGKMGDYNIKPNEMLSHNPDKLEEQLRKKGAVDEADYYMKCMSAAVQLGEKLKKRGQRADAGSRLEFVITEGPPGASKVYEKIECADYYAAHAGIIKLDILYYAEKVATPIDKMLNIIYGKDDVEREVLPLRKMDWGMPHVGVRAPMYDRYQRDMAKAMCNRYKEERKVVQQLQSYFNPHVEL